MSTTTPAENTESTADSTETLESTEAEAANSETQAESESSEPEGETPASEDTDATEDGEGEPQEGDEEKPAEEEKPKAELTEEQLQKAAQKFANKTMAAARRAQKEVSTVRSENQQLASTLKVHTDFIQELKTNPFAAIRRIGFASIKEFVQKGIDVGGEPQPPKPEDEVAALRKRLDDKEAAEKHTRAQQVIQASQQKVFAALEKDTERFDLVNTEIGQSEVWDAIVHYHKIHGSCPDDKVFELADNVESALTKKMSKSRKFNSARPSANKGTSVAGSAKPAARTTGKTITNSSSSGAPAIRDYSKMTEDERDAAILEDMRAAGEL